MTLKLHFLFSRNKKAQEAKRKIKRYYKNYSAIKSDVYVVCGGDGFMLRSIKQFYKYKKPFYGLNCGNIGFLMNDYNLKKIEHNILQSKKILIKPLLVKSVTEKNLKKKVLAINEISLLRQTKQTSSIKVTINKKIFLNNLIGDGILLATPVGSSAYNYSLGGPILTLGSNKLSLMPISPFKPRSWKGDLISNKKTFFFRNNKLHRKISLVADNQEIRNIKTVTAKQTNINIELLFNKKRNHKKKIKLLNK